MLKSDTKEIKLAPIFDFKTNKTSDNICETTGSHKRKRKNKSSKNKNKKFDKSAEEVDNTLGSLRKSKRLRDRLNENKDQISYNEDTDEEVSQELNDINLTDCETIKEKLNESVIILDENSDTIDYWTDHKTDHKTQNCLEIDSNKEEIEVIDSNNCPQICHQLIESSKSLKSSEQKECLLLTEKYKPTNTSEIIGHKLAVNKLKLWLEDWNKSDSKTYLVDDDDSDFCLDEANTCLLICGPTGSGKTSMVYAIAEELKYEVLELNASMKRNGRIISKILGEATQSHQMQRNNESNGCYMPSIRLFFNSVANNKVNDNNDIKVIKSNKKVKPKGILNYFSKQNQNSEKTQKTVNKIIVIEEKEAKSDATILPISDKSEDIPIVAPKALSIATNSLILFDDIDVMIDEDLSGFWSSFNRINEMTKKPVILTATQYIPYIKNSVNRLQVLTLNKPNYSETKSALKKIYNKEVNDNESNGETVCQYLCDTYDYDIRRSLNELQFSTEWQHIEPQTEYSRDDKSDISSYYDSLLFVDVFKKQFGINSYSENRNNWMKSKPYFNENDSQSKTLANDIIETINSLNHNIKRRTKVKEFSTLIDSETTESICTHLNPNTNLKTLVMDYCPYLSFICKLESIRQLQIANHSRRSRRFMHHLDSIGFYIDDTIKTKLICKFISEESNKILENTSESCVSDSKDNYFYD